MYILKHLKTILIHKWFVFKECVSCGLIWRGMIHDFSKFGLTEFISSAKHFQGNRSSIEAEKEAIGYSNAWLHHKGHNKHHWEYWTDFDDKGNIIVNKIPYKYVVEMICDWIGAGITYNKEKWTECEVLSYYNKVRLGRHFNEKTEELILKFLNIIDSAGLKAFHSIAKDPNTKIEYEK